MQVTKLRIANDNGLVPAGRYFAHLAEALRQANEGATPPWSKTSPNSRSASCKPALAAKRHRQCKTAPNVGIEMALN